MDEKSNRNISICRQLNANTPLRGGIPVDLAGFEPAASSVRWIKMQGEKEKMQFITSNISQNQHAVSAYQYPKCTRAVPAA